VTANQASALATVRQLDPIYVDLSQSSAELLHLKRSLSSGSLKALGSDADVELILEDGSLYAQRGKLQFSEVSVDEQTGTVLLRAVLPNPAQELLPGMCVRAVLHEGIREQAILVPQRAVSRKAGLTPNDVASAIEAQNAQVSAGQLGAIPALKGQQLNVTVNVQSRLNTPEAFGNVLLLTKANGATVRLRDVARIELGNEDYEKAARYNGQPAAGMAIRLATGANALETAERVRARLKELESFYPAGVQTVFPYDSTPFVRISIEEVVKTLAEAVVLVRVRTLADQDDLVAKGIKHAGTGYIESTLAQGRMLLEDLGASDNDVSELVSTLRENGYAMIGDANAKA